MDWHEAMPLTGLLGVEGLAHEASEVRARLVWRDDLCTAGGVLHGGALMALADSAGGLCAFLNLPDGATGTATSVEHNVPTAGARRARRGRQPPAQRWPQRDRGRDGAR